MIIGHCKILNYLYQSALNNRLSHFYLFYGPRSLGKFTVSKWLAKLLMCDKLSIKPLYFAKTISLNNVSHTEIHRNQTEQHRMVSYKQPCLVCQNCRAIEKEIYPDVLFVKKQDKARDIKIEQIRELIVNLSSSTFNGDYKIAIIDQAEFLNQEAANAFLKTLEEPPNKVIIIFLANKIDNLPLTIISRANLIKFSLVPEQEIKKFLIAEKKYESSNAKIIAQIANGRPGRALKISKSDLDKIKQTSLSLLHLLGANVVVKFKTAEKLAKDLESSKKTLDNYLRLFRDILLTKLNLTDKLLYQHLISELKVRTQKETLFSIAQKINYLEKFKENLGRNVNLRLGMENLLLRL